MTTARCVDCGYLAVRDFKSRELVEVESGMRETGVQPHVPLYDHKIYEPPPLCSAGVHNIHRELGSDQADNFLRVILTARTCDQFTTWRQGYSPREHRDMDILEKQKEDQRQRDESDRLWREKQAEQERQCRLEDVASAEETREQAIKQASKHHLTALAMCLAGIVVGAVVAIVAALISKG